MAKKRGQLDTSNEMQIFRYERGIKLIRPNQVSQLKTPLIATGQTVESLMQLPLSFYLLNQQSATEKMNEECANVCGFDSVRESLGKTLFDVSREESASQLISNCNQVIQTSAVKIFEEKNLRKDGSRFEFLSVKVPWYDDDNHVQGVCGFSIVLGRHALADSLSLITNLGFLSASPVEPRMHLNHLDLTKREEECLRLTVKGYTAKRIARALNISHRTVEEYINNLKYKLHVSTKAELIELVTVSL